jgi:hypothetical protein
MMGYETASLMNERKSAEGVVFLEKKKRERSSTADLYEKERKEHTRFWALLLSLLVLLLLGVQMEDRYSANELT